jgi:DeoR/GlpR family transcriptional regulator of sugar metabolism
LQHIAQKHYIYSMISKEERHDFILVKIKKERKLAMVDLAELGVSEHTVRRDLKELSDAGLLRAIRGEPRYVQTCHSIYTTETTLMLWRNKP